MEVDTRAAEVTTRRDKTAVPVVVVLTSRRVVRAFSRLQPTGGMGTTAYKPELTNTPLGVVVPLKTGLLTETDTVETGKITAQSSAPMLVRVVSSVAGAVALGIAVQTTPPAVSVAAGRGRRKQTAPPTPETGCRIRAVAVVVRNEPEMEKAAKAVLVLLS